MTEVSERGGLINSDSDPVGVGLATSIVQQPKFIFSHVKIHQTSEGVVSLHERYCLVGSELH